jgi:hypothetical protein
MLLETYVGWQSHLSTSLYLAFQNSLLTSFLEQQEDGWCDLAASQESLAYISLSEKEPQLFPEAEG